MADKKFEVEIKTTATGTGAQQTEADLARLKEQAQEVRQDAGANALKAQAAPEKDLGFAGSAIGIGTITTLLTAAVNKWKEFNAEQDRAVDNAIKVIEKMRELGDAILDMQDKARNAARVGTEPLEQSFIRLQQEIIRLKTEQDLLDLPRQGEEWKKLNTEIATDTSLLKGVTSELRKQAAEADKKAERDAKERAKAEAEKQELIDKAAATASPQAKTIQANEEAARRARDAGDTTSANQFQKSADAFRRGASQNVLDEVDQLARARGDIRSGPVPGGRKAGVGESQDSVNDIERNRINNERALQGQQPSANARPAGGGQSSAELVAAVKEQTGVLRQLQQQWA